MGKSFKVPDEVVKKLNKASTMIAGSSLPSIQVDWDFTTPPVNISTNQNPKLDNE